MIDTDIHKKNIVTVKNEPEWFSDLKVEVKKTCDSLPDGNTYGLGVLGRCTVPALLDGSISYKVNSDAVVISSLFENKEYIEVFKGVFELSKESFLHDKIFGYNLASVQGGVVLEIKEGQDVGEVSLQSFCKGSFSDLVVIIARKGSTCKIENSVAFEKEVQKMGRTLFIIAEDDAHVVVTNTVETIAHFSEFVYAVVDQDASVHYNETPIQDDEYKSSVTVVLHGDRANTVVHTGSVSTKESHMDLHIDVIHRADDTKSLIRGVGALMDTSQVISRHNIVIEGGIKNIEAKQSARFYIFGDKARLDTIPALDIASKDVSCQHALEISNISKEELFYPSLRGIPHKESISMIVEGAILSLLSQHESVQEAVQKKIHTVMYNT